MAARAMRMIPEVWEEKNDLKNSSRPSFVSMSFDDLPLKARTTR